MRNHNTEIDQLHHLAHLAGTHIKKLETILGKVNHKASKRIKSIRTKASANSGVLGVINSAGNLLSGRSLSSSRSSSSQILVDFVTALNKASKRNM